VTQKTPVFISASFAEEAQPIVEWFLKMIEKTGFNPIWLRRLSQPRPVKEKIKTAMKECPAMIQVWTRDLKGRPQEFGTMKEEYAWFDEIRHDGSLAVFVDKGIELAGQIKYEVEPLLFDAERLNEAAPAVVEYLLDLRKRAETRA